MTEVGLEKKDSLNLGTIQSGAVNRVGAYIGECIIHIVLIMSARDLIVLISLGKHLDEFVDG